MSVFSGNFGAIVAAINAARKHKYECALRKYKKKLKKEKQLKKLKLRLKKNDLDLIENLTKQILTNETNQSDHDCPECNMKMCEIKIRNENFSYCVLCHGCWLPGGILQKYTDFETDVPSSNLKDRNSKYSCPTCKEKMRECVFLKPHNLLVDICKNSHGVYLEQGEFDRAIIITLPPPHKKLK